MSTAWVWIRSVAIYGIIGFVYLGLSITMIVLANLEKNNEHYHCKLDQLPLVGFFLWSQAEKINTIVFTLAKLEKWTDDNFFQSKFTFSLYVISRKIIIH